MKFIALHCHAILQTKQVVSPNDTIVECIMCSLIWTNEYSNKFRNSAYNVYMFDEEKQDKNEVDFL